tara:strand:+ start:790 stop:1230 length:441 start_codon:yes stop_codon:yes gene_type:complete
MYANKKVLIMAVSSGLGKFLTLSYSREKASIINLLHNIEKINDLNNKLKTINNADDKYYSVNVSNYDEILKVKNVLLREKSLPNIIINNAVGNFLCPFEKLSVNGWKCINNIVLNSAFNIIHIFGKTFIEKNERSCFFKYFYYLFT